MRLIASKTFRTGLQRLWYNDEEKQFYVTIKNRTYESKQPIPVEKVEIWADMLGGVQFNATLVQQVVQQHKLTNDQQD